MLTPKSELHLRGRTVLAGVLRATARRRGFQLTELPGEPGVPALLIDPNDLDHGVLLPSDASLVRSIAEDATRRILRVWPSAADSSTVLLSPAAGVRGPAGHGPVDALILADRWAVRDGGRTSMVSVVATQQTRCWIAVHSRESTSVCADPQGEGVRAIPAWIAADTARICEYMQDRGSGEVWPELLVAGPVGRSGTRAQAVFAFTEGGFAEELVAVAVGEGSRT